MIDKRLASRWLAPVLAILALQGVPLPSVAGAQGLARYEGVASCAGSTCHGRAEGNGEVVRQDEIATWQAPSSPSGAHSRAYAVLDSPRGRQIAATLGLGKADFGRRMSRLPRHAGRSGPARSAVPDFRRGRLRGVPRPGFGLDRESLRDGWNSPGERRRGSGPARATASACARVPRLPFRQRGERPVRHASPDGGGASAHFVRARPVLGAAATSRCRCRLCGAQRAAEQRAAMGGGAGGSGAPLGRSVRPARPGHVGYFPRILLLRLPQLPSLDHRRARAQADLRDQSRPPDTRSECRRTTTRT